ncbi:MAG: 4-(cytidine 5'-diphospho)-2-C-methyl-D-erythritol kinase [Bacteroidales bacterium]|jgi:4-diphosphocytidyl-2-C-methyl-D-erythritol kinase|nr:4-(cytidine 5'-diphospho)-2-C-methyl-D-erythritol kinase [Bacteroidales bacterium]
MKQLTLYPGAKINIGLYVFEKREDGFHELESIFYPVGPDNSNLEPDKLTVSVCENQNEETLFYTENYSEKVRMIECGLDYPGTPQDNICVKAYEMLDADYQLPPAVIVLEKHIPVGAGLGGGSSDGVSTLKALNELCSLNLTTEQLTSYAEKLGSDCPFFVQNEPRLVTGRGEILTPLEEPACTALKNISEKYRVGITFSPDCFVSTKKAYSIVPKRKKNGLGDEDDEHPYAPVTEAITMPVEKWRGIIVNDFEAPVFKEFPQLEKVKASLKETGAVYVSMTGSGSAIYGLFPIKEV